MLFLLKKVCRSWIQSSWGDHVQARSLSRRELSEIEEKGFFPVSAPESESSFRRKDLSRCTESTMGARSDKNGWRMFLLASLYKKSVIVSKYSTYTASGAFPFCGISSNTNFSKSLRCFFQAMLCVVLSCWRDEAACKSKHGQLGWLLFPVPSLCLYGLNLGPFALKRTATLKRVAPNALLALSEPSPTSSLFGFLTRCSAFVKLRSSSVSQT